MEHDHPLERLRKSDVVLDLMQTLRLGDCLECATAIHQVPR